MSDRDKYVHVSRLSGNILVSVFFISHISEPWSPEDLEKAEQALIAGEAWIARHAMKYGKWRHFKNVFLGSGDDNRIQVHGFPTDRYIDSVQRRTELKILSACKLDDWDCYRHFVQNIHGCSQGINVFIYAKAGRSYVLGICTQQIMKNVHYVE